MKKLFCIIAILALGISACNKTEIQTPADEPATAEAVAVEAPVYHFNISANIGDGADTKAMALGATSITKEFADTDKVYVFIERSGNPGTLAVAHNGTDATTYLSPSNINGKSCKLDGEMKFYYNDNGNFAAFEPAVDDVVHLFYHMNRPVRYPYEIDYAGLNYFRQNGSIDQIVETTYGPYTWHESMGVSSFDFAEAKMKVTAVTGNGTDGYSLTMVQYDDNTKSDVHFESTVSMFRQRLSFTDKNGDPIAISTPKKMTVGFEGGDYIVETYYPLQYYSYSSQIAIDNPIISTEGDVYIALMFNDENKDKSLVLEVTDANDNVYSVNKAAPAGGFKNGKYYYGSATLAWQKCIKPTVTGTSATPNDAGKYSVEENPVNLTISGNSEGYYFEISEGHGGTITLDNLTAIIGAEFISQEYTNPAGDISLVLTGTNSITADSFWGILVNGDMKLSCTGTSATLTVTGTLNSCCGIEGNNYRSDGTFGVSYNEASTTTELDVTARLAADGYSVTRSARTDNSDGTYTWTYTVRKLGKFSVSASKQVYFSPGNLQYKASTSTWRFAEHQYDFVGDNSYGNVYVGADKCDNRLIAADYTGWIDLFGWGTSGYNNKYPYMTSTTSSDYGEGENNISGTEYDWGVHNSIGTYAAGTWRTPTHDEWVYLLNTDKSSGRNDAYRFARGMVHSVKGLIIFPDGFDPVAAGVTISNPNTVAVEATTYSDADWTKMEAAGCVFLPMAGTRSGTSVTLLSSVNTSGFYWSSTYEHVFGENAYAYALYFNNGSFVNPSYAGHLYNKGDAVRLVRDVPTNP